MLNKIKLCQKWPVKEVEVEANVILKAFVTVIVQRCFCNYNKNSHTNIFLCYLLQLIGAQKCDYILILQPTIHRSAKLQHIKVTYISLTPNQLVTSVFQIA